MLLLHHKPLFRKRVSFSIFYSCLEPLQKAPVIATSNIVLIISKFPQNLMEAPAVIGKWWKTNWILLIPLGLGAAFQPARF